MEVEGQINQGGLVGEMKVGGMVQVKDENEQNVMCVYAEGATFGEREGRMEGSVIAENECETDRRIVRRSSRWTWEQQSEAEEHSLCSPGCLSACVFVVCLPVCPPFRWPVCCLVWKMFPCISSVLKLRPIITSSSPLL